MDKSKMINSVSCAALGLLASLSHGESTCAHGRKIKGEKIVFGLSQIACNPADLLQSIQTVIWESSLFISVVLISKSSQSNNVL